MFTVEELEGKTNTVLVEKSPKTKHMTLVKQQRVFKMKESEKSLKQLCGATELVVMLPTFTIWPC